MAQFALFFCITLFMVFGYDFAATVKKFPKLMSKPFRVFGINFRISTRTFGIILYIMLFLLILFIGFVLIPMSK